ncbi:hypothetical protein ACS0TY_019232 [Phlomoides rotata]
MSNRVNKVGRRFGFVRFGSHVNRALVQKELNDIWFGSYKLRANVARFNRSREGNDLSKQQQEATPPRVIPPCGYGDRSFAEVVNGGNRDLLLNKSVSTQYNKKWDGMRFESSEKDRSYLKQSFLGFLKEDCLWIDIGTRIQGKGEGMFAVKYLGGSLVLIHPTKPERIKIEDLECLTPWFDSFKQWSDEVVGNNRVIWTNWFGVPMHAWNTKFFNLILSQTFHISVRDEAEFLEEDSEDWSSEDESDEDGESDYDLEDSESDTYDPSTKDLENSDGNPIAGRIDKSNCHSGDNSNIATTQLVVQSPIASSAQNTILLSTTPASTKVVSKCALAPSLVEEKVDSSLLKRSELEVGDPILPAGSLGTKAVVGNMKNQAVGTSTFIMKSKVLCCSESEIMGMEQVDQDPKGFSGLKTKAHSEVGGSIGLEEIS